MRKKGIKENIITKKKKFYAVTLETKDVELL